MKKVVLEIPDQKYDFFMDLIEQLGLETSGEPEIRPSHKEIVRERIKTEKSGKAVTWSQARKEFVFNSERG